MDEFVKSTKEELFDHFPKPVDVKKLKKGVKRALEEGAGLQQQIISEDKACSHFFAIIEERSHPFGKNFYLLMPRIQK